LLTEGVLAPGHPKFEATMIRNHAITFEHVWRDVRRYRTLDPEKAADLHRLPVGVRDQPACRD
jgi:hypothetical protein